MVGLLGLGFFLASGCQPPGERLVWEDSVHAAMSAAAATRRPVLLVFTREWDEWSRRLMEETLRDPEVVRALGAFHLVRIDADRDKTTASAYGVFLVPSLLVRDYRGEELYRITGFRSARQLLTELASARRAAGGKEE